MLFIVAGNKKQADRYAHSINLKPREYKYVCRNSDLRGMPRGLEFSRIGTWYEHPNIYEIDKALQMREAVEIFGIKSANRPLQSTETTGG